MSEPLLDLIRRTRRRYRAMQILGGVSLALACTLLLAVPAVLVDRQLRINDPAMRLALAMLVGAGFVFAVYHLVWRPLRKSISDVEVAGWIERRHPHLAGRLSSAVDFASARDHRAGESGELRHRLMDETRARIQLLEHRPAIGSRTARRRAWMLGGSLLLAAAVCFLFQIDAVVAVQRLVRPLGTDRWPRMTDLQFVDEQGQPFFYAETFTRRIAIGEPFEVLVANRKGAVPDDTVLELRNPRSIRIERIRLFDPARDADRLFRRRRSIVWRYRTDVPKLVRAIGGDDATRWFRIQPVRPPTLESPTVSIVPPAYTGRDRVERQPIGDELQLLAGSRVTIRARSNKPLESATLVVGGDQAVPAVISENGHAVAASMEIAAAGSVTWRLDIQDTDHLTRESVLDGAFQALEDMPPVITISPSSLPRHVTPNARVAIRLMISDDVGIESVACHYRAGTGGRAGSTDVFAAAEDSRPDQLELDWIWLPADWELKVGSEVTLRFEAMDVGDHTEARPTVSEEFRIRVISDSRMLAEVDSSFGLLRRQLASLAAQQAELCESVQQQDPPPDRIHFQHILDRQTRLTRRLRGHEQSIASQIRSLSDELSDNGLAGSPPAPDLDLAAARLEAIGTRYADDIPRDLLLVVSALDGDDGSPDDNESLSDLIPRIVDNQRAVEKAVRQLVGDLAFHAERAILTRKIRNLLTEQQRIHQQTSAANARLVSQAAKNAPPDERLRIEEIERQQRDLSRVTGKYSSRLGTLVADAAATGSRQSATVKHHQDISRLSTQMLLAAEHLAVLQTARAVTVQEQILAELASLQSRVDTGHQAAGRMAAQVSGAQIVDTLNRLIEGQARLTGSADALRNEIAETGRTTRSQARRMLELGDRQSTVSDHTRTLSNSAQLEMAGAVTPTSVAQTMQTASERLASRRLDHSTTSLMQQAVDRLIIIRDSVEQSGATHNTDGDPSGRNVTDGATDNSDVPPQGEGTSGTGASGATAGADSRLEPAVRNFREMWKHLPPSIRRKLPDPAAERPVQEYEDLIRRYFRTLAEQRSRDDRNRIEPSAGQFPDRLRSMSR